MGAVLVIAGSYYWPLALLLFIVYPLFTWLTALTSRRWQKLEHEKNVELDLAGGRFAEVIGQIRVVKSYVRERQELADFDDHYRAAVTTTHRQSHWWHLMDVARRGSLNLIFFGIYVIIFWRTAAGAFTLGDMVMLLQMIALARTPVMMMSYLVDSSQHAIAGSRSYFEVMDETPSPRPPSAASGRPISMPRWGRRRRRPVCPRPTMGRRRPGLRIRGRELRLRRGLRPAGHLVRGGAG